MFDVLRKESVVPIAYLHHPTTHRPGNSLTKLPGLEKYSTINGNQNNIQLVENIDMSNIQNNETNKFEVYPGESEAKLPDKILSEKFNGINNAYVNLSTSMNNF
jgi:hypothetical protein